MEENLNSVQPTTDERGVAPDTERTRNKSRLLWEDHEITGIFDLESDSATPSKSLIETTSTQEEPDLRKDCITCQVRKIKCERAPGHVTCDYCARHKFSCRIARDATMRSGAALIAETEANAARDNAPAVRGDEERRSAPELPLRLRDAMGREFLFPWTHAKTWKVSVYCQTSEMDHMMTLNYLPGNRRSYPAGFPACQSCWQRSTGRAL